MATEACSHKPRVLCHGPNMPAVRCLFFPTFLASTRLAGPVKRFKLHAIAMSGRCGRSRTPREREEEEDGAGAGGGKCGSIQRRENTCHSSSGNGAKVLAVHSLTKAQLDRRGAETRLFRLFSILLVNFGSHQRFFIERLIGRHCRVRRREASECENSDGEATNTTAGL